ncbi:hypothetical protein IGI37_000532 [Enterococcus sp. AZ194]|uniref:hypothetical protein n=1 Tax=Enterococcus sp. AZ194 TaxID=2774629 RepID=UPI003F27677C
MQSQFHYTEKFTNPQNVHLRKQSDPQIISAVIWSQMAGHKTQSSSYRAIRIEISPTDFPERSCFCRICQNLSFTIKLMRYFFIKELTLGTDLVIVDSLPSLLYKSIRNCRKKSLILATIQRRRCIIMA